MEAQYIFSSTDLDISVLRCTYIKTFPSIFFFSFITVLTEAFSVAQPKPYTWHEVLGNSKKLLNNLSCCMLLVVVHGCDLIRNGSSMKAEHCFGQLKLELVV